MKKVFISAFLLLSLLTLNGCKSNQPPVKETGEPYGVNLACADFGSSFPGEYNKDYTYPTDQDLEYWQKKGLKLIRLPFKWERLQLDLKGPLNQHDLNKMKELVRAAEKRDMVVLLDLHNYCRRYMNNEHTLIGNNGLTIGDLASFWQAIAKEFSTFKNIYGYG